MRKRTLIATVSGATALTATLILMGCGGGGGPLKPPSNQPPPSVSQQFLQLLPPAQQGATYVGSSSCANCHSSKAAGRDGSGAVTVDFAEWAKTKHAQVSIGCEQCHGPASIHVASPTADNILTMPTIANSVVCGQCHTGQKSDFDVSPHAKPVEDVMTEAKANPGFYGKTCLRCHSGPFRADLIENTVDNSVPAYQRADQIDANIQALTNDQIVSYVNATTEAPSCVNCHDPMRTTPNLDLTGGQAQLLRAIENSDVSVVGQPSTPVKIISTYNQICANCHMGGSSSTSNPSDSALNSGTSRPNFHENPQFYMLMGLGGVTGAGGVPTTMAHASRPGQCVGCHMPNGRHSFTVSLDISCQPCHTPADAQARLAVQGEIQLRLYNLVSRLQTWSKATFGDPDLWDYTAQVPAGKTAPPQSQVPIQVKRARHNYYFVLRDLSLGVHNPVYARLLLDVANQNLDALGVSRAAAVPYNGKTVPAYVKATLQEYLRRSYQAEMSAGHGV